jgi:hypothetical protein
MSESSDNPYAAPQAELGQTQRKVVPQQRTRQPPRWLWLLVIPLNTLAPFAFASELLDSPFHVVAIVLGIVVVGLPYALQEMLLRRTGAIFLADVFFYGAVFRIPCQLLPVVDAIAGLFAISFLQFWGLGLNNLGRFDPLHCFAMTVLVGGQLAIFALLVGLIPAAIIAADRKQFS